MCDWETELVIRDYAEQQLFKAYQKHRKTQRWLYDILRFPDQNRGVIIARERHGFPDTHSSQIINPCEHCDTLECTWPNDDGVDACPVSGKYRSTYHCTISQLMCGHCGMGFTGEEIRDPNWPKNHSADADVRHCPCCGAGPHPFLFDIILEFPPMVKAK
jgi:hypothetical protein